MEMASKEARILYFADMLHASIMEIENNLCSNIYDPEKEKKMMTISNAYAEVLEEYVALFRDLVVPENYDL